MTDETTREQDVALRPAVMEDATFLLRIRNHPSIRAVSFNQDPVPLEDHIKWLSARLGQRPAHLYVVTGRRGEDAGVLRLDLSEFGDATVSVNIAPDQRRRGIGVAALQTLTTQARQDRRIRRLVAYILPDNEASLAVFGRAGYREAGWIAADPGGDGPPQACWRCELPLAGS